MAFCNTRGRQHGQWRGLLLLVIGFVSVALTQLGVPSVGWIQQPFGPTNSQTLPKVSHLRSLVASNAPEFSEAATPSASEWATALKQAAVGFMMAWVVIFVGMDKCVAEEGAAQPSSSLSQSQTSPSKSKMRPLISVGDLHGDYKNTMSILRNLGLVDQNGDWSGGNTVLVQTGDIVDRGNKSGQIWEELFKLQSQAPKSGGEVVLLLGNHELMNMQGDFRYAPSTDTSYLKKQAGIESSAVRESRTAIFAPDGYIGQQLRAKCQTAALFGREFGLEKPVLYVHAGILPALAEEMKSTSGEGAMAVAKLNQVVKDKLAGDQVKLQAETTALFGDDGPFWTRHLALDSESGGACKDLQKSLDVFGAYRMVVGHTAQSDGEVHTRCGGRLVLGDTLISEAYTGTSHPSAVQIQQDGSAVALYPGTGKQQVLPNP